mgnify:CR=1 FL=1
MQRRRGRGLDGVIPSLAQPVLGICIGVQRVCLSSEEGDTRCMGIFPARVRRLPAAAPDGGRIKVPHVGWDTLSGLRLPLFDGLAFGEGLAVSLAGFVLVLAATLVPTLAALRKEPATVLAMGE